MDYFDCDYFGDYFDTPDCAPAGKPPRVVRRVLRREPPVPALDPDADEAYLVLI